MKLSFRLCLSLIALAPLVALAQPKKAAPPAAPPPAAPVDDGDMVTVYSGRATYLDDDEGIARLTKNVVISQKSENLTVYAQDAVYNKARNQANASNQLRVTTRNSTVTGLKLFADFDERQFTISGNVLITSHGKNDGEAGKLKSETSKNPVRVACKQVVWEYDTQQATVTGDIHIAQGTNKGTCNEILYDEKNNIVWLKGNVRFGNDKNQSFLGQDVKVYLDTNTISTEGNSRMMFPKKDGPSGDSNADTKKTPRPKKTPVAFAPPPVLRKNAAGGIEAPPVAATPEPTATEEPAPTLPPLPPDEEEKPTTDLKP